jgi:flagellar hook assembly protein FlgD
MHTRATSLGNNYPNPFSTETTIPFVIGETTDVSMIIYNMLGQPVIRLLQTTLEPGSHKVTWDGTSDNGDPVAPGVYLCKMLTGSKIFTQRIEFVK